MKSKNKPTGRWEPPNRRYVQRIFRIGNKAIEDDFDRKGRYIKYFFWGVSVVFLIVLVIAL